MSQPPRTVTVVTLLVVTATLLPVVGVANTGHGDSAEAGRPTVATPQYDTTVRLHRVPNDTPATDLPNYVGIDEPSDPVFVAGDALVVSIRSGDLASDISDAPGSSLTERFVATQADGSRLWAIQTGPGYGYGPVGIDLTDSANVTVVTGDGPATYHIVIDTGAVDTYAVGRDDDEDDVSRLREIGLLYVGFEGPNIPERPLPNRTTALVDPRVDVHTSYVDGVLRQEPGPNLTVTGTTTLPPSSSVTLELFEGSTERLVAENSVAVERVVTDSGTVRFTFTGSLPFPDEGGTNYTLRVRGDNRWLSVQRIPVRVVPRKATLSFDSDTVEQGTYVDSVNLTHGGFVSIRNESIEGDVLDTSRYVAAEQHDERLRIWFQEPLSTRTSVVAVAYRDVNGNGEFDTVDEPYRENGAPVTATAVLRPPAETATATVEPTPSTASVTGTAVATDTTTTPMVVQVGPTEANGGGSVPGFDALGTVAALGGLCSLVMLRRR